VGGVSTNSCAQAQPQALDSTSSTDKKEANDKASRQLSPEGDSSSQIADPQVKTPDYDNSLGLHSLKNIAEDQKAIWTSPTHLRLIDADWLLPLGIAAGGMLATDTEVSKHLSNSASRLKYSNDVANYGIASLVAAGGGLYIWGHVTHDDHKRETGFLAAEAALNSLAVTYATKYAFGRERPLQDNFKGDFWQGGDSFPSEHASAAWSIASVIAHEYPGPLTSLFAYGLASAVTASRISAKQHFPTDALVGSAIGWFVGEEVYRHHHDPELGGGEWQTYAESREEGPGRRSTSVGSPYVELDSWIYPAMERLAALGYIHSEFLGMRPWTRIECAQLVEEAGDKIRTEAPVPEEADRLDAALVREFSGDLDGLGGGDERSARLESAYTRMTEISGPPLHDSYHFGQTIINDYGRPYEEGFNTYDGLSGYATAGRFTIYLRGEYQHAPFAPAYSDSVRQTISTIDINPVQPATPFSTTDQFRLLDSYVAANVAGWDFSFGKQSLWWGPGEGGAFLSSDNAEPMYMFRASRVAPFTLPWVFHWMGPMKWDVFFGKLSGNEFPPRPFVHGEKISFKPTPNLELGFSRTVELGGVGRPFTFGHLLLSYFSLTSPVNETPNTDPGKRIGGFDFSYKVPFIRNWLTVYSDSLADDDPSPLANPPRAAINPGIYMARLPGLPKLDLRVESVYTNTPRSSKGGHFVYWDSFYHDLYTNKGNIIGSWIGREGTGFQAWSTYWAGPRNSIRFGYRHSTTSRDFISGGGNLSDGSISVNWWIHNDWNLSASSQYEKWNIPALASTPQSNWTTSFQVGFWPRSWEK
jgi:membrane-associated phospholipid phosphatase